MLTETWAPKHDPVLPAKWNSKDTPAPLLVYLDQWCYDHLARDRAGQPFDGEEGLFAQFRQLALDGRVIFLLSITNYWENWVRRNTDARWDTAVAMAELSGFNTLSTNGLSGWEAQLAVAAVTGLELELAKPNVFGWGLAHCLSGNEASPLIIDTRTGRPARWDRLPAAQQAAVAGLERRAAERFELGMLARRDPRMEPDLQPFAPVPDSGNGQRLVDEEHAIRDAIDGWKRTPSNVRVAVEGRCFTDTATILALNAACLALGTTFEALLDQLGQHAIGEPSRQAFSQLIAAMPIQGRYAELRVQSHMQANRKRKTSDGRDYFQVATIAPFVDYMLTDEKTWNLAESGDLAQRGGATFLCKLTDLRHRLEHALSHSEEVAESSLYLDGADHRLS
jgi:hypothetical protein